jgi:hypothetical protein
MRISAHRIVTSCLAGALGAVLVAAPMATFAGDGETGDGWFPFQPVRDEFEPTILDLSSMVQAPTGTRGFVRAENEGFVFEDGGAARFWGVDLALVGKTDAVYLLRRLRKLGVNAVRVSWPQVGPDETPLAWERLDFLVSQMAEQGIYLDLSLGGLDALARDAVAEAPTSDVVLAPFFDAGAAAKSFDRLRDAAGHRNIYTGRRYCDDPTVALVELGRGASLFGPAVDTLSPEAKQGIEGAFAAWLRDRYGSDSALSRAWTVGSHVPLVAGEGLKAKRVGLLPTQVVLQPGLGGHPELLKRTQDQLRFLLHLEESYWTSARDRLREIGVRVPIAASPETGAGVGAALHLQAVAGLDDVVRDGYWDEPASQSEGPVTLSSALFHNLPMVKQLGTSRASADNLVLAHSWEQVLGRPMMIGGWSSCLPNQFSLEGVGLMAAYGSLQGWDGVFEHGILTPLWVTSLGPGPFNMFANPPQLLQVPAAAALWHRGDVQEASLVSEAVRGGDASFDPSAPGPDVVPESALVGRVGTRFTAAPRPGVLRDIERYWDPRARVARSLTGELEWNALAGLVTVESARTEAWIGFVGGAIRRLSAAALDTNTPFAAVYVTALDGQQAIPDARHILVTAVGPARNQGMAYEHVAGPGDAVARQMWHLQAVGEKPIMLQAVVGSLRVRTAHWSDLKAWALDNTGRRRDAIELTRDNGFVTLPMQPRWAVVYYELSAE